MNHQLVVLAFTTVYFLLLSTLVAYDWHSTLHNLFAIHAYLLLRCLLSDRYLNLFNQEITLFLLISRMLIYLSLLLNITITFYILFGNTNLISGRFFLLGWLWPLGFSPCSLNPYCSLATTGVFVLFIWIISGPWHSLSMLTREFYPFCALYCFVLDYILFFASLEVHLMQPFSLLGLWWDTGHICLFTIWQTN